MPEILQSQSTANRRRVYFTAVKIDDVTDYLTSTEMSGGSWTIKIAKLGAGSAATPSSTTITEYDTTNYPGLWFWEGNAADFDTLGPMIVKIQNTGGTKTMRQRDIEIFVTATDRIYGTPPADVTKWNGTNVASPNTAGYPRVDVHFMEAGTLTSTAAADNFLTANKIASSAFALAKFAADAKLSLFGIVDSGTATAGSSTTMTLQAGASSLNSSYVNGIVLAVSGTGALEANQIDSYNGTTKVATMKAAWGTTVDNTTSYVIFANGAPGSAPSASAVATAVWGATSENGTSYGNQWRGIFAILGGKVQDFRTGTLIFKGMDGATTRATGVVTASGRVSITWNNLDP